ncbi:MAG: methyltransferase domain-containing protein [Actinomycetota bacterium]|nr:methyltransferase domain-containing protein [Actinomycetota bacterium]
MESVDFLTQEVVRQLGEVRGKKVLELGIAKTCLSTRLVAQGASPTLVEESPEKVAKLRSSEQFNEIKFEVRQSKLADLAFCPAESIDIAFSIIAFAGAGDSARLFRQIHRVLRNQGTLIFGLLHPMAFMNHQLPGSSEQIRYRSREVVDREKLSLDFPVPLPDKLRLVSFGEVFSELKRAGLGVDQLLEIPEGNPSETSDDPIALLIRARKY